MTGWVRVLVCAALLASASGAMAEVTLYEHDDFRGRSFTANRPIEDLERFGFNDRASSASVRSGSWQFCSDAGFQGRCVTLGPGDYRTLEAIGLNDRVSSVRPGGGPPGPGPGPGPGHERARMTLYDFGGFGGRPVTLDRNVVDFAQIGFNDRANSAVVEEGTWQVCEHEEFQGSCMTLQPGRYPDLGSLAGRVSSARIIGWDPPNPPPRPQGARAVLYSERDFRGRSLALDSSVVRDFANSGFNDRAESLRIERGYWMFCSDANFEGECRTFGPGSYGVLPPELRNRVSSGRRISDTYPYRDPPNWGR